MKLGKCSMLLPQNNSLISKFLEELRERGGAPGGLSIETARSNLLDFTCYTFPGYEVGEVHRLICAELDQFLQDVVDGLSPRLLLFCPPRHGKSELVSRRFPAYALGQYPDLSIIATSYGADLASRMNRDVQRIVDSDKYRRLFPGTQLFGKQIRTIGYGTYLRNSDIFEVVGHQGVYRSSGVGGGITGMGFNVGILDDPIKDAEQAHSKTYRDKLWEWYLQVFSTRAEPGAGIIGMWTRWHVDDMGGRLLKAQGKGGDKWKVISLPAIALEGDLLGRSPGEALWPTRYPIEKLMQIKNSPGEDGAGSSAFAALYQQNPEIAGGNIFKREWWQFYRALPAFERIVQGWDTAYESKERSDFSCCTTWGVAQNGYYLLNVWKGQVEMPELKTMAKALNEKYCPSQVLVEAKASGKSLVQELKRETRIPIHEVNVVGDKEARASSCTPLIESGRVFLPEGGTPGSEWLADYLDSMASFPVGIHDDDVDSTTLVLNHLLRQTEVRLRWL